jgi:hypothetical protein
MYPKIKAFLVLKILTNLTNKLPACQFGIYTGIEGLLKLPLAPGKMWGIIQREGVKYAGTGFLSAYWVGRSHGLISEQE